MPATLTDDTITAEDSDDRSVVRLVADRLAERGIPSAIEEEHWLTLPGAGGEFYADAYGQVVWAFRLPPAQCDDPVRIVRTILRLLGAEDLAGLDFSPAPRDTLRRTVGAALHALGLAVRLVVSEDAVAWRVCVELAVSDPSRPSRGEVRLADNGELSWSCLCGPEPGLAAEDIAHTLATVLHCP
ncbi:hypothetical protein ACFWY9_28845 [Amycolatopsis sp. NPDC059027]|uniref:hypothetical protein n=1 Tax=Amycolatopsis sp. NPDC059027 TaxID=3346709 RepID=UPI00366F2A20